MNEITRVIAPSYFCLFMIASKKVVPQALQIHSKTKVCFTKKNVIDFAEECEFNAYEN